MTFVPRRRCTGCMESHDKSTMIRIVRSPDGTFSIDRTGKAAGRGAYMCNSISCLLRARKRHGLEKSFSARIDARIYDELECELIHAK